MWAVYIETFGTRVSEFRAFGFTVLGLRVLKGLGF